MKNSNKERPSCRADHKEVILKWGNGECKKTIPLGINDNVATITTSPGFNKFEAFKATINDEDTQEENSNVCVTCNETYIED